MGSWSGLQCRACIFSCGAVLKFNQKAAGCPIHTYHNCTQGHILSLWSLLQFTGFKTGKNVDRHRCPPPQEAARSLCSTLWYYDSYLAWRRLPCKYWLDFSMPCVQAMWVFSIGVSPSSSGGQPRAMAIACIVLKVCGEKKQLCLYITVTNYLKKKFRKQSISLAIVKPTRRIFNQGGDGCMYWALSIIDERNTARHQ